MHTQIQTDSDPQDEIQLSQAFQPTKESTLDKPADIVEEIVTLVENIKEKGGKFYTIFRDEIHYIFFSFQLKRVKNLGCFMY